jgi:polysaccharide deacetylase 2 family uncharacterized protein YibQ
LARPRRIVALWLGLSMIALPAAAQSSGTPFISIVIDDLGDRWDEGRQVVALPGPVACAVLPETPHGARLAALAHAAGKEVLLHLPLQPLQGKPHPMSLSAGMAEPQREALLQRALASVPHVVGVNNHQGSATTQQAEPMRWLMRALRQQGGLYFLDSYTTAASVAQGIAQAEGLPTTRRQVFLDAERNPAAVRKEWKRLLQMARVHGSAVAIGHPFPETLAMLREEIPRLGMSIELVAPSELIRRQGRHRGLRIAGISLRFSETLSWPRPANEDAGETDELMIDQAPLPALPASES